MHTNSNYYENKCLLVLQNKQEKYRGKLYLNSVYSEDKRLQEKFSFVMHSYKVTNKILLLLSKFAGNSNIELGCYKSDNVLN